MLARRHETGDVRHVDHQNRADLVADLTELREVDRAAVRACARDDQLRTELERLLANVLVVDDAVLVYAVGNAVIVFAGHIDRAAVGEVTAVRKVHAHERVARVQHRKEHRHVRLCAGMRLHVCVIAAEQLLRALDRKVLHDVHKLAAAVVTLARIALRVLVGEHAAHRHQDRFGYDVLGCDQLQVAALTVQLVLHCRADLGIVL